MVLTRRLRWLVIGTVVVLVALSLALWSSAALRGWFWSQWGAMRGSYTVEERIAMHSGAVRERLEGKFKAVGLAYPPAELAYVFFKDSKSLEVYARSDAKEDWQFVFDDPVQAASGVLGPKLREGDNQVPEGIYAAELLNPNSRFHLSIRLNYPNAFDQQMAREEGRTTLGGDIMIHGGAVSVGCLAMGDDVAQDLFILAALAGIEHVRIVVSPTDFRTDSIHSVPNQPAWLALLYASIRSELTQYHRGHRFAGVPASNVAQSSDPLSLAQR